MHQKLFKSLDKKGYLQIDFLFAATAFLVLFSSLYFLYIQNVDALEDSYYLEEAQILAKDICYLLYSQSGVPINWEVSPSLVNVVGLKHPTENYISQNKVNQLSNQSNYFTILDSLNIDYFVYVNISVSSDDSSYLFGIKPEVSNYKGGYVCYSPFTSNELLAKISVEVWK